MSKNKCSGTGCNNEAGSLQCPTCLKLLLTQSYFCSQDCFKKNWSTHKAVHKTRNVQAAGLYDPFPAYHYTGSVRPVYPLSPRRLVPDVIPHPDWSETGIPKREMRLNRSKWDFLDAKGQDGMRKVCRLAREVLDITAAAIKPGVTTDYLDEICHQACVERQSYPSPLNYNHFPKSLCTSPNEIVCHGIPDQRVLLDGDILNLDISLYHGGYHADLNETYYVGDKAKADPDSVKLVETTREALDKAIEIAKPGLPIREFGKVIEKHAASRGLAVVKMWGGHGINSEFHPPPWIPHYAKNKAAGTCRPGLTFTIEPILTLGADKLVDWPDDWTNVTADGKRSAQFEHTLLITETGVECLTARLENSPGGPIPIPEVANDYAKK
ncbi:putative methionine aminopeptidase, type I [Xylaria scruposa]|nr:putative methionine aminopeptidase, type I [Xylaria scruposa]